MSRDQVKELSALWHAVGMQMKAEMHGGSYLALAGISMVELSILEVIEKQPASRMKEISGQLALPKSTLTSAVKRLERKGLLIRGSCQEDKRAYNLVLTETGREAQQEHREIENLVFDKILRRLDDEERELFVKLLAKGVEDLPVHKKSEEELR